MKCWCRISWLIDIVAFSLSLCLFEIKYNAFISLALSCLVNCQIRSSKDTSATHSLLLLFMILVTLTMEGEAKSILSKAQFSKETSCPARFRFPCVVFFSSLKNNCSFLSLLLFWIYAREQTRPQCHFSIVRTLANLNLILIDHAEK